MRFLDRLEEGIITFLMARHADDLRRGAAPLCRGLPHPGRQERLLALDFSWAQERAFSCSVDVQVGAAYGVRTGYHAGSTCSLTGTARAGPQALLAALAGGVLFTGMIGALACPSCGGRPALRPGVALGLAWTAVASGATTPDLGWPTGWVYSLCRWARP